MENHHEVIIIGGGVAGLAAGVYCARNMRDVLVIKGYETDQLSTTTLVENIPGSDPIQGPDYVQKLERQAEEFGAKIDFEEITKVDFSHRPFQLWARDKKYTADAVILATGANPRKINVPGEERFSGFGCSYCATCDAPFFKDKTVVLQGGGDSAMTEALHIARYTDDVTLFHRSDSFRASKIMLDRVKAHPTIKLVEWSQIVEIKGEQTVNAVVVENTQTGETSEMSTDGVFVAIGHIPNSSIFEQIKKDDEGYVLTEGKSTCTNIPGIVACGDLQDKIYRQVATSVGTAVMAALDVESYLENLPTS